MTIVVVYDSLYGNTETIAHAIAEVMPGKVQAQRVGDVDPTELAATDLLIIGSPTHGALPTEAVQALVDRIGPPAHRDAKAATFDTRLTWRFLERWGGFAAPKIAVLLKEQGWTIVGEPGGFFVRGLKKGPLRKGEVARAAAWSEDLAESVA
jgi:flavorubredoxin